MQGTLSHRPFAIRFAVVASLLFVLTPPAAFADTEHLLYHDDQRLQVTLDAQFDANAEQQLMTWVEHMSTALLQVYGRWPRDRWRIRINAVAVGGGDPVPWAEVRRGLEDEIAFLVDSRPDARALMNDWSGYHELAHLLLPYQGIGERWFSEGVATYYQNLLMVRSGQINERDMWQRLHDGFQRGRARNPLPDHSLAQLDDNYYSSGTYMRAYWSGAWLFLAADVELRSRAGQQRSLDDALASLNHCCGNQRLPVSQLVEELDRYSGDQTFSALYREAAQSRAVPDFEALLRKLGVTVNAGRVSLQPHGADLRRRIVRRHSGLSGLRSSR